jgi:hypothetical protein
MATESENWNFTGQITKDQLNIPQRQPRRLKPIIHSLERKTTGSIRLEKQKSLNKLIINDRLRILMESRPRIRSHGTLRSEERQQMIPFTFNTDNGITKEEGRFSTASDITLSNRPTKKEPKHTATPMSKIIHWLLN